MGWGRFEPPPYIHMCDICGSSINEVIVHVSTVINVSKLKGPIRTNVKYPLNICFECYLHLTDITSLPLEPEAMVNIMESIMEDKQIIYDLADRARKILMEK